jgi:hypothetical protein
MDEVIGSVEWEQEWITLDRDQLVEFLRSSDLVVKDEYEFYKPTEKVSEIYLDAFVQFPIFQFHRVAEEPS